MKKLLFLIISISSWLFSFGQITEAEYFFDGIDPGLGNANPISLTAGMNIDETVTIPTIGLPNGLHLLHIRTKGTGGVWSLYERSFFYIHQPNNTLISQNITDAEYFIDSDPGTGNATSFPITSDLNIDETFSIPTTSLSSGLHVLHIRVKDNNNIWSLYERSFFYIHQPNNINIPQDLVEAEYFIDNDPGVGSATALSITSGQQIDELFTIPTASLTDGLHLLHIRVKDANNIWSLYERSFFYIHPPNNANVAQDLVEAEYFIDNDPGVGNANSLAITQGLTIDEIFSIPTASLTNGLHVLHIRVKDASNIWSLYDRSFFFIHNSNNNLTLTPIVDAEYFLDIDPGVGNGIPIDVTDGLDVVEIFSAPIPLALADGDHYLHVRVIDQDGTWSLYRRKLFIVDSSVGTNSCTGITKTWNGVWDGDGFPPTVDDLVIIDANYNTNTNGNIDACSCTINPGNKITIEANDYVSLTNDLVNNGEINVKNDGAFTQFHQNATVTGSGNYNVERITNPYLQYDYTYWSSPTTSETINSVFSANNPNFIYEFTTANFEDLYSGTYPQTTGIPDTFDDNNDDWYWVNGVTNMIPGKGYIAQGPGSALINTQTINFTQTFNTGDISIPVTLDNNLTDNADNDNLIGNPYPSSIDAIAFMLKNSVLSGTLYFWTHNTQLSGANPGPDALNFTNNDYSTWVAAGGVTANSGGQKPTDFIASCQGFFASVNGNGTVTFENSMRLKENNSDFFKTSQNEELPNLEGHQVWLNLTHENGIFRQILIGFYAEATNNHDRLFDGKRLFSGNNYDFSSLNGTTQYAIQGFPYYTDEKIVPLSVKATEIGEITIGLDEFDSFFDSQNIYIRDNELQIIHDLKLSNYHVNITSFGEFNDRFELLFRNSALHIDDQNTNQDALIVTNYSAESIKVKMQNNSIISELIIYDLLGKILYHKKPNSSNFVLNTLLLKMRDVIFIKAKLKSGKVEMKKFVKTQLHETSKLISFIKRKKFILKYFHKKIKFAFLIELNKYRL